MKCNRVKVLIFFGKCSNINSKLKYRYPKNLLKYNDKVFLLHYETTLVSVINNSATFNCIIYVCFSSYDMLKLSNVICSFLLSVLMLDEAHERTLYTDIAIGLLKKVTRFLLIPTVEQINLSYLHNENSL